MIDAATLRRLAALNLPTEAFRQVLAILADISATEEKKPLAELETKEAALFHHEEIEDYVERGGRLSRKLLAAGTPPDAIVIAVEAMELQRADLEARITELEEREERRLKRDRDRKAAARSATKAATVQGLSADIPSPAAWPCSVPTRDGVLRAI
jgi:hypothetical protein